MSLRNCNLNKIYRKSDTFCKTKGSLSKILSTYFFFQYETNYLNRQNSSNKWSFLQQGQNSKPLVQKAKSDILYSAHTAHWYLKLWQAGNYSLEGNESFWCLISSRRQNGHSQKENQCRERRLFKHTMKNLSKGLQCHTVVIIFSSSSIHHLLPIPLSLSPSLFTSVWR